MRIAKYERLDARTIIDHAPELLFCCAAFIWLTMRVVETSMLAKWTHETFFTTDFVVHRMPFLLGAAELIRIWRGEYGRRDALGLAIVFAMGYGMWLRGWNDMLCAISLVFCARNVDIRRLCIASLAYVSVLAGIVVILSQLNVIPDYVLEHTRASRHCLGFTYCLHPSQYLFILTLGLCWLRGRRITLWEAALLVAANVWFYAMTVSRLCFGLSLVCVAVTLLYKWDKNQRIPWARVSGVLRWAFPAMVGFSIVITIVYIAGGAVTDLSFINKLLGGRVRLQSEGVINFGLPLFGQDVTFVGNGFGLSGPTGGRAIGYNYVDNLFFHAGIRYGLVFSVCLMALFTFTACDAHKDGDVLLVVVIALLAAHSLLDDHDLWLHYNVLLFNFASLGREGCTIWLKKTKS